MPFLDINGLSLHYRQHTALPSADDKRPPLLMLAGMASDSMSWQPVVKPLREHQSLLTPDNRCSGQTRVEPLECSRDAMVGDILALLDHLDIERVNVLGHSMGGMLGWALACQAPDRVSHLICASALPQIAPARIALFRSLLALRSESNEADWFPLLYQFFFRPSFFDEPGIVRLTVEASTAYPYKQSLKSFGAQVAALESFLPTLPLQNRQCPVTMLTGSHDVLTSPRMLEEFAAAHPDIQTHIVEGAAHSLHWEQAMAFAQIVESALGSED